MLYFSEIKNKNLVTESNKIIGKVNDLIFLASEKPLITKLVVKNQENKIFLIPIRFLKKIEKNIILENDYRDIGSSNSEENELYIVRNLLDKQIIDIKGGKVVRVNDVVIQEKEAEKEFYIAGVDIGLRGILRWIGLEKPTTPLYRAFGLYSHPHFLSWGDIEPLELAQGKVKLKKEIQDLQRLRPEDLADYLEKTNIRNVNKIVENLDERFAADVIEDLNISYQTTLLKRFNSEKGAKLIEHIDPDEAVDILLALTKEKREEILNLLSYKKRKEILQLIKYSQTPIGQLINPEFITISADDTVSTALGKVKNIISKSHFSAYIYSLNQSNQLTGVIDLSDLITHSLDTPIHKIMTQNVIVIHLTTPKEIAIKKLLKYKLYALPVIEGDKKLVGIVTYDDLVEDLLKNL